VGAARKVLLTMLTAVITMMAPMPSAHADGCPNEQIRQKQVYGSRLPDCRAYEQVSPIAKNLTDAAGEPGVVQASPSGAGVSFFSVAPFPGTAGSGGQVPTYLSARAPVGDDWLTEGLLPAADPGSHEQVIGLTEDLTSTILFAEEPVLVPGAEPGARNAYVEENGTGAYQLLAANIGYETFSFVDATPGGTRILFEATAGLPTANVAPASGVVNLYEWNEARPLGKRVSLAGVLPNNEAPKSGSVAGPGGPALGGVTGGATGQFYTQNTISEDGARVFFSDLETGIIYMREPEAERTVQVSAGTEPAYWRAATPSGSFVFYTEAGGLYRWCKRLREGAPCEGEDDAGEPVTTQIADTTADVQGTLGVSNDGSYVYFVATGKLASNKNGNGEGAESGADNLYEWHEEVETHTLATTFIARLLGLGNSSSNQDEPDWRGYDEGPSEGGGPAGGEKSSRVAPDGKAVLFGSVSQLTSYDNNGEIEFYLYNAEHPLSSGNPACVSCNPSGSPGFSGAHLTAASGDLIASPVARNAFLTHNLSTDGSRVFFQTEEALVPEDTNNQLDVYEWERAREETNPEEPVATDSCERASPSFSERDGGCLYLISTGQSAQPSYFGDASESGDNVFFFTRQSLVGQDQDLNVDVYDARVDGGIAAQNPPPPPAPCTDETSCHGASDPPAALAAPSSATIAAEGNLAPRPAAKPKPLTRAQKLARALKACRTSNKHSKRKRSSCEKSARKRYRPLKKKTK